MTRESFVRQGGLFVFRVLAAVCVDFAFFIGISRGRLVRCDVKVPCDIGTIGRGSEYLNLLSGSAAQNLYVRGL